MDDFFEAKFFKDSAGEYHVRPGWNAVKWFEDQTADLVKTCSPDIQHWNRKLSR